VTGNAVMPAECKDIDLFRGTHTDALHDGATTAKNAANLRVSTTHNRSCVPFEESIAFMLSWPCGLPLRIKS
jgi:hypothetical protein